LENAAASLAADFKAEPGMQYAWIYDHARFRYRDALASIDRSEQKGLGVLKASSAVAVGVWAVLSFVFAQRHSLPGGYSRWFVVSAFGALFIAAITATFSVIPLTRVTVPPEISAVRLTNVSSGQDETIGRFALLMSGAADAALYRATQKARCVLFSTWVLIAATALLLISLMSSARGLLQQGSGGSSATRSTAAGRHAVAAQAPLAMEKPVFPAMKQSPPRDAQPVSPSVPISPRHHPS